MTFNFLRRLVILSPLAYGLYLIRFQVAGIPLTLLELLTYVLFGLWLIELIRDHRIFKWNPRTRNYLLTAFLLLIGVTIGVLVTPHSIPQINGEILDAQRVALGVWKGWVLAPILYFVVLIQTLKTREDVEQILRIFIYSAVLISLAGYILGIFGSGLTYDLRLSSIFESANYLSLFLVPAVLLNVYFVLTRQLPLKKQNYIDVATLTVLIHALFFTQSYAAVLGVFGAIVLYVLYYGLKFLGWKKASRILFFLILIFAVIVGTQLNSRKFRQFLDFQNRSSTSVRLEIYQISTELISQHPLTGVGPGLFQVYYQNVAHPTLGHVPLEWNIPHPHNVFLAFWLNAGLLGLLALLILIVLADLRFTYPLVALWGMLIHGLFDTPFWKNDLAMVFWLILASILILQNADTSPQKPKAATRGRSSKSPRKRASGRQRKA